MRYDVEVAEVANVDSRKLAQLAQRLADVIERAESAGEQHNADMVEAADPDESVMCFQVANRAGRDPAFATIVDALHR